jgi:long-chain fatty acid transport protein
MSRTVRQVALATCLGAIALCLASEKAQASAFALREESAEGLGNAFAGQTAKAYNASTVYYNPAGMALLDHNEIDATVTWIQPDLVFRGSNSNPLYGAGIGGPTVNGVQGPNDIKPAALGSTFIAYKIDSDWHVGFSFAVPYGQRSEYRDNWVGRYQALASDITDYEASLVLSYKVNDQLSVGGGPRIDYMTGRLSEALNVSAIGLNVAQGLGAGAQKAGAGATAAAAAGNLALAQQLGAQAAALAAQASGMQTLALGWAAAGSDGLGKLTGDDVGVGYTLSALYVFDPANRLGITYKSRIFHDLSGSSQVQLPGNAGAAPAAFNGLFVNQNANLKVTLPDTATVGFYHEIDERWAVMSDVQWTDWSVLKNLTVVGATTGVISSVPENWTNSWYVALGVNWKPIERWTLHFGTAYDGAPMNDRNRLARIPDVNRYWTAIGASYAVSPSSDVHFGYAHLFTPGGGITDATAASTGGGVLTGSYTASVDIVSASFALKF